MTSWVQRALGRKTALPADDAPSTASFPTKREARGDEAESAPGREPLSEGVGGRTWAHLSILERVGAGGFGQVYRAWDPLLQREVALKTLHRKSLGDTGSRMLVSEGRLLARIRHANVVSVHGACEFAGEVGIWMEFVRGSTLEELLALRGPFGAREAAGIGLDLCRALAGIHAQKLLHRDIKAQNVMREEGGRIVLMDMGLGRELHPELRGARERAPAGTPAYMAPELLNGGAASVQSEIYALGVLLYRLVTGKFPVAARHVDELRKAHDEGRISTLRDTRPDLPMAFIQVVERALSPKPELRFESAGQLERALASAFGAESAHATAAPGVGNGKPLRVRILTVSLLALLFVVLWPAREPGIPPGTLVLLSTIENSSADPQLDAVTEMLRGQLAQSSHFNLVDPGFVREILGRMLRPVDAPVDAATAREAAWREGIPFLVTGRVAALGASFMLYLQVESVGDDLRDSNFTLTRVFQAKGKEGIFDAVDEGGRWVRETVGERPGDIEEKDLDARRATTRSWPALVLFSRAEALKARGRDTDAILLLKEALAQDPEFALANTRLGDILCGLGRYAEGYSYWLKTISLLGRRPLTVREEMRIRGMYAYDTGNYREAEGRFRTYALAYSNDWYPWFCLGLVLDTMGRRGEAVEVLFRGQRLRPSAYQIPVHLATIRMSDSPPGVVSSHIRRVRELGQPHWADFLEGRARFLQEQYEASQASFSSLCNSPDPYWKSKGHGLLGAFLAERGRYADALRTLDAGIAFDEAAGFTGMQADKLLSKAYILYRLGARAAARAACAEALGEARDPIRIQRGAAILARSGFAAEAEKLLPRLKLDYAVPVFQAAAHRTRGEIMLARGEPALKEFEAAEGLDPIAANRVYVARAFLMLGRHEEALRLYRAIAAAPSDLLRYADERFPGIWAETLVEYGVLAFELKEFDEAARALELYLRLRAGADPDLPEVARARGILRGLRGPPP